MAVIANLSIDLSKIDKSRVVTKGSSKYLNLDVVIRDEINQYNQNVGAYHTQSKDEREAKEKKHYVGNGRVVFENGPVQKVPYGDKAVAPAETEELDF